MGDDGAGSVQWKVCTPSFSAHPWMIYTVREADLCQCDADLPEGMRFGRVEVSCEGWTRSGDPNILQGKLTLRGCRGSTAETALAGSCGLSYELATIDPGLERGEYDDPFGRLRRSASDDILSTTTQAIALLTTLFVVYQLLSKLARWMWPALGGGQRPGGAGGGGGGGGGPGFGGGQPPPPPPYTKEAPSNTEVYPPGAASAQTQQQGVGGGGGGMTPGFWTGLAAGGAATYMLNRRNGAAADTTPARRTNRRVDWDDPDDRGVGPSTGGGGMRRATAFGSSSTR